MTFDYANTAATALRLLTRFGASATLKVYSGTAYDPATGTVTATYTDNAATACVFDYPQKYVDGTLILAGDKQAYMASAPVPKQGDKLAWQAVDYTVVAVKAIAPSGVAVVYEAQIRG